MPITGDPHVNSIPSIDKPLRSVLLFGPLVRVKGTLGRTLAQAGSHCHLSSGEIFRGLSPASIAGQLFHTYASKGHLVPDDLLISIWHQFVIGLIATNRYFPEEQLLLLDGIPRTSVQATALDTYIEVVHVIVLEMPNINHLVQRMKRRALIEGRADDAQESVVQRRMEIYEKDTAQLLLHYPKEKISRFNADQTPVEVVRDVLTKLAHLLR
jgi:adenylate kinase